MTSLQEAMLAEIERNKNNKNCRVAMFVHSLSQADQQIFEAALADLEFSNSSIARIVGKVRPNDPLSRKLIGIHRAGDCSCQS